MLNANRSNFGQSSTYKAIFDVIKEWTRKFGNVAILTKFYSLSLCTTFVASGSAEVKRIKYKKNASINIMKMMLIIFFLSCHDCLELYIHFYFFSLLLIRRAQLWTLSVSMYFYIDLPLPQFYSALRIYVGSITVLLSHSRPHSTWN